MREKLEKRLASLKSDFESGQKMLADLEAKEVNMRSTLLRISGAIQVLEEELAQTVKSEPQNVISMATGEGASG